MAESAQESRNRVRDFRELRGWSQEDLARAAGVSVFTISRLERGLFRPNLDTAKDLAKTFGVSIEELFPDRPEKAAV